MLLWYIYFEKKIQGIKYGRRIRCEPRGHPAVALFVSEIRRLS